MHARIHLNSICRCRRRWQRKYENQLAYVADLESRLQHAESRNAALVKAHWPAVVRIKVVEQENIALRRAASEHGVPLAPRSPGAQQPSSAGQGAGAPASASGEPALTGHEPPAEDLPGLRAQYMALQEAFLQLQVVLDSTSDQAAHPVLPAPRLMCCCAAAR